MDLCNYDVLLCCETTITNLLCKNFNRKRLQIYSHGNLVVEENTIREFKQVTFSATVFTHSEKLSPESPDQS